LISSQHYAFLQAILAARANSKEAAGADPDLANLVFKNLLRCSKIVARLLAFFASVQFSAEKQFTDIKVIATAMYDRNELIFNGKLLNDYIRRLRYAPSFAFTITHMYKFLSSLSPPSPQPPS
jgi:hypothetical protein